MVKNPVSRRGFLAGLGAGLAAPYVLTGGAWGQAAPSDQVRMGHIGVGGMGGGHLGRYRHNKQYPTVALCDVDENRRNTLAKGVGPHCKTYGDFRELLDRTDIDAVVIATPDHWHAIVAIAAAEAGKDIYCEKPMTLTIREGRAMVNAIRRYGRVFQTGSQQRSENAHRFWRACTAVRAGRIGKVQTIHISVGGPSGPCYLPAEPTPKGMDWDTWLGPAPWRPFNKRLHPFRWRSFRDYSGGGMTDWGAHHFDIAQWGLGMDQSGPVEVIPPHEAENGKLTYVYANGVRMFHWPGSCKGVLFTGTEGKIEVSRSYLGSEPPEIVGEPFRPDELLLFRSPGHHANWQQCLRSRERPICDVEIGHRSVTVCHIGNLCYWLKRRLQWDPAKEQFVDDPEANRWLDRPRRAPWRL